MPPGKPFNFKMGTGKTEQTLGKVAGPDPDLSVLGGLKLGEGSRRPSCGSRAKPWWGVLGGMENDFLCLRCLWRALLDSIL